MSDTCQGTNRNVPRGISKGYRCGVDDAGAGESVSSLLHGAGGWHDLIRGQGNAELRSVGDILVDVDAGPGGTGLVVWIVGG